MSGKDCEHRYELKALGPGEGAMLTLAGFQCMKCGHAYVTKAPTHPQEKEELYGGWV